MRKPENAFIAGVEKYLPHDDLHHEKMANPYRGGTADSWYSGRQGDLWIEYKWLDKLPKTTCIALIHGKSPLLSRLQVLWLNGRHCEGRNIAVVVGAPEGCLLLRNREWLRKDIDADYFRNHCLTRKHLANWISMEVTGVSL